MRTRRSNKRNVTSPSDRVDTGPNGAIAFDPRRTDSGQPNDLSPDKADDGGRTIIHPDAWYEWVAAAQYVFRINSEAEIVDVFEWLRIHDLGGTPITAGLLARIDREIATELREGR